MQFNAAWLRRHAALIGYEKVMKFFFCNGTSFQASSIYSKTPAIAANQVIFRVRDESLFFEHADQDCIT